MIEYQRIILGDSVRNAAYRAALEQTIKPGMVVADLGAGTGYLSFLASQFGAKECHLYEQSALSDLSRTIAKENGIRNCRFIRKHSQEVASPTKADLVVTETLGNFAYEEGILETMNDAKRFLKPGGSILPRSLTLFVVPVVSAVHWEEITVWNRVDPSLDFSAARALSLNNIYVRTFRPSDLLPGEKSVQIIDRVHFDRHNASVRRLRVLWPVDRAATIYGFALFWECELVPGVTLSTSPWQPNIHWEQVFLPLLEPMRIATGEKLTLRLLCDSRREVRLNVKWETVLTNSSGTEKVHMVQDMRKGDVPA